ncbi:MAG TPA: VWA domain-containing protein [Kofleriaceae bacterium]
MIVILVACGPSSSGSPPDSPPPACFADSDCGLGMRCEGGTCIDNNCGGESLELTYVPPNLLLVLDRSCSMRQIPATATMSKWQIAVDSIKQVITSYANDIRWGLTLFPDKTLAECTQQDFAFPLADGNGPGIQALLTNALVATDPLYPRDPCVTNIDTGLTQAATDPALSDPARQSYLMLITDGAQSNGCTAGGGDAGAEMAVQQLFSHGIKTFVIGFGGAVDAVQLNKMAVAGGTPQSGTTKYFRADTAGELDMAFASIADQVIGCSYLVDPPPEDLAQTYVWFEKTELVPRDLTHMAGWDYDPATQLITLYGMYCDRLRTHVVDTVDVIFGCPSPPVL